MVLSAVSCLHQLSCGDSSVTEFRDVRRLLDQLVRRRRVSASVFSGVFCCSCQTSSPRQYRKYSTATFTENVSSADQLVMSTVGFALLRDVCHYFCLGGCCVLAGVSLHVSVAGVGLERMKEGESGRDRV